MKKELNEVKKNDNLNTKNVAKNEKNTTKIAVKNAKKDAKTTQKTLKNEAKNNLDCKEKAIKNTTKTTKNEAKKVRYLKIKIVDFVRELKADFKKYKNVEKLTVVDQFEDKLPKMKENETYYICQNQNGNLVIKSGFMLDYGYRKLPKGSFVPVDKGYVMALKTSKNITFSDSFGGTTKLKTGDYVVIQNKNIIGMKKSDFEENYVLLNKANKILKNYEEELVK